MTKIMTISLPVAIIAQSIFICVRERLEKWPNNEKNLWAFVGVTSLTDHQMVLVSMCKNNPRSDKSDKNLSIRGHISPAKHSVIIIIWHMFRIRFLLATFFVLYLNILFICPGGEKPKWTEAMDTYFLMLIAIQ